MRITRGRLSCEDVLEIGWTNLVEAARSHPGLVERLERRTAQLLDDPSGLAKLPDLDAAFIARLAHLGLGELMVRMVGRG